MIVLPSSFYFYSSMMYKIAKYLLSLAIAVIRAISCLYITITGNLLSVHFFLHSIINDTCFAVIMDRFCECCFLIINIRFCIGINNVILLSYIVFKLFFFQFTFIWNVKDSVWSQSSSVQCNILHFLFKQAPVIRFPCFALWHYYVLKPLKLPHWGIQIVKDGIVV